MLEILLSAPEAIGAYDILARLKDTGFDAKPPVAYRALDFLITHGFAHKIERLNTYIACAYPCQDHAPAFMICRSCDKITETRAPRRETTLHDAAGRTGFQIEETVIESYGFCLHCRTGIENRPSIT